MYWSQSGVTWSVPLKNWVSPLDCIPLILICLFEGLPFSPVQLGPSWLCSTGLGCAQLGSRSPDGPTFFYRENFQLTGIASRVPVTNWRKLFRGNLWDSDVYDEIIRWSVNRACNTFSGIIVIKMWLSENRSTWSNSLNIIYDLLLVL